METVKRFSANRTLQYQRKLGKSALMSLWDISACWNRGQAARGDGVGLESHALGQQLQGVLHGAALDVRDGDVQRVQPGHAELGGALLHLGQPLVGGLVGQRQLAQALGGEGAL